MLKLVNMAVKFVGMSVETPYCFHETTLREKDKLAEVAKDSYFFILLSPGKIGKTLSH